MALIQIIDKKKKKLHLFELNANNSLPIDSLRSRFSTAVGLGYSRINEARPITYADASIINHIYRTLFSHPIGKRIWYTSHYFQVICNECTFPTTAYFSFHMCSGSESQTVDFNLGLMSLHKWGKMVAGETSLVNMRRDPLERKICDTCFSFYRQIYSQHQNTANGSEMAERCRKQCPVDASGQDKY